MSDTYLPLVTPRELAATYNTPSYEDPWSAVEDYQRVLDYTAVNPDAGSTAVASALDLPRSRIRPWMNGSRPDVVRGIQAAESREWLSTDRPTQRALLQLAAWVLSGGSLLSTPNYHVAFTLDDDEQREFFAEIAADANLQYEVVRAEETNRATEARPSEAGSVLARLLHALGIPGGSKTEGLTGLPDVLTRVDDDFRLAFARVYLRIRAIEHPDKDTLTIQEDRDPQYLRELASFLADVSGESVTASTDRVTVSAAAARALRE